MGFKEVVWVQYKINLKILSSPHGSLVTQTTSTLGSTFERFLYPRLYHHNTTATIATMMTAMMTTFWLCPPLYPGPSFLSTMRCHNDDVPQAVTPLQCDDATIMAQRWWWHRVTTTTTTTMSMTAMVWWPHLCHWNNNNNNTMSPPHHCTTTLMTMTAQWHHLCHWNYNNATMPPPPHPHVNDDKDSMVALPIPLKWQ